MLLGIAVALVTGVVLGVLGAEGLGDALVGGGRLAVDGGLRPSGTTSPT
jgi:hypothetical protein